MFFVEIYILHKTKEVYLLELLGRVAHKGSRPGFALYATAEAGDIYNKFSPYIFFYHGYYIWKQF